MSDHSDHRGPRNPRSRPPQGGRRPGGSGQGQGFRRPGPPESLPLEDTARIEKLLAEAEQALANSIHAVHLPELSPPERKYVHEFFENKLDYETKTYRDGDNHVLWVFPVGNLKKYAEEKANEALASGAVVALPPMSNYERFVIHDSLKDWESIETSSEGEGESRHVLIAPAKFGRTLKRIAKKIKLF